MSDAFGRETRQSISQVKLVWGRLALYGDATCDLIERNVYGNQGSGSAMEQGAEIGGEQTWENARAYV